VPLLAPEFDAVAPEFEAWGAEVGVTLGESVTGGEISVSASAAASSFFECPSLRWFWCCSD
jgi:hypothetical protein